MLTQFHSRPFILAAGVCALIFGAALVGCDRQEFEVDDDVEVSESSAELGEHYTLHVDRDDLIVGEEGIVGFEIRPGDHLEINLDFPWRVEFDEVEGIEFGEQQLGRGDLDLEKERAIMPVDLTALDEGQFRIEARADFSVCNDQRCDIMRDEPVEFIVQAQ